MNTRHSQFVASSILIFFIMAACALTPMSSPTPAPVITTLPASTPVPPAAIATATAAVPLANPTAISPNGACANDYYPNSAGVTWDYSSTGGALGSYTNTETVSTASTSGFTTQYAYSTGVNASIDWKCQDGNLAALDAGASSFNMTTSKVKMTSTGVTADGYNVPASFAAGATWSENVTTDGTVTSNAGKTANSQIVMQLSCSAAGIDTITVPAGKFDTAKASCTRKVVVSALEGGKMVQLGANQENITYWYAKGTGYVQSVATGGSNNETVVLTQFKSK